MVAGGTPPSKSKVSPRGVSMDEFRSLMLDTPEAPPGTPASFKMTTPVPTPQGSEATDPWHGASVFQEGGPGHHTMSPITREDSCSGENHVTVKLPRIQSGKEGEVQDRVLVSSRNSSEVLDDVTDKNGLLENCDNLLSKENTFLTTDYANG